jgi:protein-tyrosine-phosphatase
MISTKTPDGNPFKGIQSVGLVCIDNTRLSPVAEVLLNRMAIESRNPKVRGISFHSAGYNRTIDKVADSAKGYLQMLGFSISPFMETDRINKDWLISKDLILTMDKFIRRDILFNYFPGSETEWANKILVLNEAAGIGDKIRDPGSDPTADIKPVYNLIRRCCEALIKKLEGANL